MSEVIRRAGRTLLVLAVVLLIVLLLLLPPTQDLLRGIFLDPFSPRYPQEVRMEVARTLTLDANGGEVLDYSIRAPKPVSVTSDGVYLQRLQRLSLSPSPDGSLDRGSYETMVWEGKGLTDVFTLRITMEVAQTLKVWELDEKSVLDRGQIPQYYSDRYLGDQWRIVVQDPAIETLRQMIVGDEENVYLIARSIYEWMDSNIDYHIWTGTDGPLTSVETYREGKGDCDDQSILFCALARSAGVPAWLQLGALYDRSTGMMGGHAWVQMFMPTKEGGTNVTIDIVNDRFLVWMPNLLCEYTDTGDPDDLFDAYHHVRYSVPISTPQEQMPVLNEAWEVLEYEEGERTVVLELEMWCRLEF